MLFRQILTCVVVGFGLTVASPSCGLAQVKVLSAAPPNVEYQYQLYYPRLWGWPGPGMSIGGSLPSKGREGISSFYGRPFPAPLGAGVYVNPFAYSTMLPGPGPAFGLASSTPTPTGIPQGTDAAISQTAAVSPMTPTNAPAGAVVPAHATTNTAIRQLIPASNTEAIKRSQEMEAIGDEHFQRQQWVQAFINYRNAVLVAGDRAEAHMRLGFACIVIKRYPEAALAFKQALAIDPLAGKTGETLETVFGIADPTVRTEIVRGVANWSKENLSDQDHLFLLAVILRYNNDVRSDEILAAAMRMPGPNEHLLALATPPMPHAESTMQVSASPLPLSSEPVRLPELHDQPLALKQLMQ